MTKNQLLNVLNIRKEKFKSFSNYKNAFTEKERDIFHALADELETIINSIECDAVHKMTQVFHGDIKRKCGEKEW